MSLLYVNLILNLTDGSGAAATYGTARFTPSATLTDVADGALITQSPVTATFGPGGSPVVRLLQTDSPNVQPAGWAWQATLNVEGQPPAMQFALPAGPASFTATNATPAVFTIPNSTGFGASAPPDGTGVTLAGGSLPAGFTGSTTYYVVNASGLTFELSATQGGGPIASTSTGSGTVTAVSYQLSAVTPVESAAAFMPYLPMPSGTPADGDVPTVIQVSPLELDWGAGGGGGGGGSGTVTTASVATANGFAGTVANASTTPAITLTTTASGVLKGNGTAISAAVANTDYATPAFVTSAASSAQSAAEAASLPSTDDLSAIATANATAGNVPMNGHKLTGLPNGTASGDSAAFGQIPLIDSTGTDIAASPGTQAAGGVGKAADAGHVHPQPPVFAPSGLTGATAASRYVGATAGGPPQSGAFLLADWALDQSAGAIWICVTAGTPGTWRRAGDAAWQFRPESYGAKGDVRSVSDAAITSGQHALTSSTAAFTSADVGKTVYLYGAGAAGADLLTTIATFTNSTTVQLTATAGSTVSAHGAVIATDDTAAVRAAYAAAHAYALASPSLRGQVTLSALYGIAGAAVIGGATAGNAQIPLTPVVATSGPKVRIEWAGDHGLDAAELSHWLQASPQMSGPGLVCLRLDGTNDATNGPASVIGGPVHLYGAATSTFSNMSVVLSNFRIILPFNSTFGGADFFGCAEDVESGFATDVLAIVPASGAWPQKNQASITNTYTFGLRKGDTNNNDRQDFSGYSSEGLCYGAMVSEHGQWDSMRTLYSIIACELYAGSNMAHGVYGGYLSAEDCAFAVGVSLPFGNTVKAVIAMLDIESSSLLFDSSNLMSGVINVMANNTPGYAAYSVTGGTGVKIYELMALSGPIASPQAPAGFGTPWVNSYNRDVWGSVSATTITGLTITSKGGVAVAQVIPSGATCYAFFLPEGSSYTATGTGSLAHTVTRS